MFSRVWVVVFPKPAFDVPESFRHAFGMDQDGKDRARAYVLRAMSEAGVRDHLHLAALADLDPGTVRTFLDGKSYPQGAKRAAIEAALGLVGASIELAARGVLDSEPDVDPVESAIEASALTRGNKKRLIGTYYDMLDAQHERGA